MLQVILFSVFFGLELQQLGKKASYYRSFDAVAEVMFKVTNWVMQLAPIGWCLDWCDSCSDGTKVIGVTRILYICFLSDDDFLYGCYFGYCVENL